MLPELIQIKEGCFMKRFYVLLVFVFFFGVDIFAGGSSEPLVENPVTITSPATYSGSGYIWVKGSTATFSIPKKTYDNLRGYSNRDYGFVELNGVPINNGSYICGPREWDAANFSHNTRTEVINYTHTITNNLTVSINRYLREYPEKIEPDNRPTIIVSDKYGSLIKSYIFKVDTTGPTAPSITLSSNGLVVGSYTNGSTITATHGTSTDTGGCGINRYVFQKRIDDGDWVNISSGSTISASEKYEVRAYAYDNLGNVSSVTSKILYVDVTGPAETKFYSDPILYLADSGSLYMNYSWDEPADMPAVNVGTGSYKWDFTQNEVSKKCSLSNITSTSFNTPYLTPNENDIDIYDENVNVKKILEYDQNFYLEVLAFDKLGKQEIDNWGKSAPFIFPSAPIVSNVTYTDKPYIKNESGNIVYPFSIEFKNENVTGNSDYSGSNNSEKWTDYLSYINKLKIYCNFDGLAEPFLLKEITSADLSGLLDTSKSYFTYNGEIDRTSELFGIEDEELQYFISIQYKTEGTEEFWLDGIGSRKNKLPNYQGISSLYRLDNGIKKDIGESFIPGDYEFGVNVENIVENLDFEDDEIYYRLFSNFNYPISSVLRVGSTKTLFFNNSGNYNVNVELFEDESNDGIFGELADAPYNVYNNLQTITVDAGNELAVSSFGKVLTENGFEWTEISEEKKIGLVDNEIHLQIQLKYGNNDQRIINNVFTLDIDAYRSFISQYDTSGEIDSLTDLELIKDVPHIVFNSAVKDSIEDNSVSFLTEVENDSESIYSLDYRENESYKYLVVYDGINYFAKIVGIDAEPPEVDNSVKVDIFSTINGQEYANFILENNTPEGIIYLLEYGTNQYMLNNEGMFCVPLENYDFNEKLDVILWAHDRAGNRNIDLVSFEFYAPSWLPEDSWSEEYNVITFDSIINNGEYNGLSISYMNSLGENENLDNETFGVEEGKLKFQLPAEFKYSDKIYTFISTNDNGVEVSRDFKIKGNFYPPQYSVLDLDDNIHGQFDNIAFNVNDPDSDPYTVFIKMNSNGEWKTIVSADSYYSVNLSQTEWPLLESNTVNELNVRIVSDGSDDLLENYTFTYDNVKPELIIDKLLLDVSNRNSLTLEFNDDVLLDSVTAVLTAVNFNQVLFSLGDGSGINTTDIVLSNSIADGLYTLTVSGKDKANNYSEVSRQFILDRTKAVINTIKINGITSSDFIYATGAISLSVDGNDANGFDKLVVTQLAGSEELNRTDFYDNNDGKFYGKVLKAVKDGSVTDIEFTLIDKAGNETAFINRKSVLWDMSFPKVKVTGFSSNSPECFSALSDIEFLYNTSDEHSGIAISQTGIRKSGDVDYSWSPDLYGNGIILEQGTEYEFSVKSVNNCGLENSSLPLSLVYDNSAPDLRGLDIGLANGGTEAVSGEILELSIDAIEDYDNIDYFKLQIGTPSQTNHLSSQIAGNKNGELIWRNNKGRFILPDCDDGNYIIYVSAYNRLGLSKSMQTGFSINNEVEKILLSGIGKVVSSPNINFTSIYSGNEIAGSVYNWELFLKDGTKLVEGEQTSPKFSFTTSELGLTQGDEYFFKIKNLNLDGRLIESNSLVFLYDTTAPVIKSLGTETYSTSYNLSFNYEIQEDSGVVKEIEYRLEKLDKDNNFTDIGSWQKHGIQSDALSISGCINIRNIDLLTGDRLRLVVRAINNGMLSSHYAYSSLVRIDDTEPENAVVIDEGDYSNLGSGLSFAYYFNEVDNESGLRKLYYTHIDDDFRISENDWVELDINESGVVHLTADELVGDLEGTTRIFAIRAINGSGLESVSYSNGILVDSTKPDILSIAVDNEEFNNIHYINNFRNINFQITAYDGTHDSSSGLDKIRYQLGNYNGSEWKAVSVIKEIDYTSSRIDFTAIVDESDFGSDLFSLKLEMIDKSGNSSAGYSPVIKLVNKPECNINNLVGWITTLDGNENLYFTWDIDSNIPLKNVDSTLGRDNSTVNVPFEMSDNNSVLYKTSVLAVDGIYSLKVDVDAFLNSMDSCVSNNVVLDLSAPVIEHTDVCDFAADNVIFDLGIGENLSNISEVYYALGDSANSSSLSDGWVLLESLSSQVQSAVYHDKVIDIDRDELSEGNVLVLSVQTVNDRGRVAQYQIPETIIVDLTPARINFLTVPKYTMLENSIGHDGKNKLEISLADNLSGIDNYEWALSTSKSAPDDNSSIWQRVELPENNSNFLMEMDRLIMGTGILDDSSEYYIHFKVQNKAREIIRNIVSSTSVRTDFTKPEIEFDIAENRMDNLGRFVVNDEAVYRIPFGFMDNSIMEWLGTDVILNRILVETETGTRHDYLNAADWDGNIIDIDIVDEAGHRNYTLTAYYEDEAGNANETDLVVRFNTSPRVSLNSEICLFTGEEGENLFIPTTPGKPVNIIDFLIIEDDEGYHSGDYSVTYDFELNDARDPDNLEMRASDGTLDVAYLHRDPVASDESTYHFNLVITDAFGKESQNTSLPVRVGNTEIGPLYYDEIWHNGHRVTGDIQVPDTTGLEIQEFAEVLIADIDGKCGFSIDVSGNLKINNGVKIHKEISDINLWSGFRIINSGNGITPVVDISGSVIQHANRCITAEYNTTVTIDNTEFRDSKIGIHNFSNNFTASNCEFINCFMYAIKEDGEFNPVIIDPVFTNNLYDYYDRSLTVTDFDTLNMPETNGNTEGE